MDEAWLDAFQEGVMNAPPEEDPFALAWSAAGAADDPWMGTAPRDPADVDEHDPHTEHPLATDAAPSEPESTTDATSDDECDVADRRGRKTRQSDRERREKKQKTENVVELGALAELYVVHISDLMPSDTGEMLVTLTSGPPPGWTSYQTVRRLTAWLSMRHGTALQTTSVFLGSKRFRVCVLQSALSPRRTVYLPTDVPRVADVVFRPEEAAWLATDIQDTAAPWGVLPADDGTGYGGYWRQSARPPGSSWTVWLEDVKEPAALLSSLLLLPQLPSECRMLPSGALVVRPDAAVPMLDGAAALRDGGFWTRVALTHWAASLAPRSAAAAEASRFRRVWNVLRIHDAPTLPWSHALLLCTGLMRRLRARCTQRSRERCYRLLRLVVASVTVETGRRGLSATVRRIREGMPLALALRTDDAALSKLCYHILVATLSPLLPGDRLSEILRGASLESTLVTILLSNGAPSAAQFTSFDPHALLDALSRVSAGLTNEEQWAFLRNDTRVLPDPHAVVPHARRWLDLLVVARHTLCQSYELRDTTGGTWPWEGRVTHRTGDSQQRTDTNAVLWISGHELLSAPHTLLFPSSAKEDDRQTRAVTLEFTADDGAADRLSHWRISADLVWDGSSAAAGAVLDALVELVGADDDPAPAVHLVLGGGECPLHFVQHFTRQMSARLYRPCWNDDLEPSAPCPAYLHVPAGEWLEGTAVFVHSCMGPAVASLLRDPSEPWLVLHAYQVPPSTMRWLATGSTSARRVRVDVGSAAVRPPPEFRWRHELAPWLRVIKAPRGAATGLLDDSHEPSEITRWSTWCAGVRTNERPRVFARQPVSASLCVLPPCDDTLRGKIRWAELVNWPRVLYQDCHYMSASGRTAAVLDPELTERERRWLGSASWVRAPGAAPQPAAAQPALWISGDVTTATVYPWLPCVRRTDGSALLAVWHPLVSRLT